MTSVDYNPGQLPVNELFQTIQGEATWTGTPAVFVRLQGCDVGCPWCDTKNTWTVNPDREITLASMLSKETDTDSYAAIGVSTLVSTIKSFQAKHVVITGGEPCRYDLVPLTQALLCEGYSAQIETSGTEPVRVDPNAWVTVSPKLDMPGGREFLWSSAERANEIKLPVGKAADIERFLRLWNSMKEKFPLSFNPTVWLQPLSASDRATRLCIEACTRFGWRLSIQTHKFIGVR